MSILAPELIRRYSAVRSRNADNGGIMSAQSVPAGVLGATFPDITEAERAAGLALKAKQFWHVATLAAAPLANVSVYLIQPTLSAGTRMRLFAGTQRGTQGDLTGSERYYGIGSLHADMASAATTLTVDCETGAGADGIFQAGDTLWIADGTGEEFATIDSVTWTGDQAAITLTAGIIGAYAAATPTVVASCLTQASIAPSFEAPVITGAVGYDHAWHPPALDYIATVEEIITLTFADAVNFSAISDTQGSLGSGSQAADFTIMNAHFGRPRFTLPAAGWTGPANAGDTVSFALHPAAIPFWLELIVNAGAAAGTDGAGIGIHGEA